MTRFALTLTRPLIFLPALAAAVAVAGISALVMMPASDAAAAIVAPADPLPVTKAVGGRDRTCDSCGIMKTIRRIDPTTGLSTFEFSVRMRDGSTRDSTGATRGRWVEGERVILIGGTAARALEEGKAARS